MTELNCLSRNGNLNIVCCLTNACVCVCVCVCVWYIQNTDIAQSCTLKSAVCEVVQVRGVWGLLGAVLVVQSDSCREEGPVISLLHTLWVKESVEVLNIIRGKETFTNMCAEMHTYLLSEKKSALWKKKSACAKSPSDSWHVQPILSQHRARVSESASF